MDNKINNLNQYVNNIYNHGAFHNPSSVSNYDKDHIPFLASKNDTQYVFDAVREKLKEGESNNLQKNISNGKVFRLSNVLTDSHIDYVS